MDDKKKKVVSQSEHTTTKDIPDGKVETTRRSSVIQNEDGSTSYVSQVKEKTIGSSRIGEPQKVEEYDLGVSMEDTKYVDIIRTKDELAILKEEKLITYIKVRSFERVLQLMKESLDTYFDSLSFGIYSSEEIIEFRNSVRIDPPKKQRYTKNFDLYLSEEAQLNRFKRMGEDMFLSVQREVDRIREEEEEEERLRKEEEERLRKEEEERLRKEEEERLRKEEEERLRKEEEERLRKEEEERLRKEEEERLRKEEELRKQQEEELLRQKQAEEELRRQKEAEEELRRQKAAEEELRRQKEAEEELRRQKEAEEELMRQKQAEEELRRQQEEELMRKKAAEEELMRQKAAEEE